MAKILKQKGQYVCRLTLRHLTPEETLSTVQIATQLHFDNMITKRIGHKSVPGDFPTEDLTPEYEHYRGHTIKEGTDNAYEEGLPDGGNLDPLPMPEAGANYISAEVLRPLGSALGRERLSVASATLTATKLAGHMTSPSLTHRLMTLS
jgi:hypothetical protein